MRDMERWRVSGAGGGDDGMNAGGLGPLLPQPEGKVALVSASHETVVPSLPSTSSTLPASQRGGGC